MEKKCIKCGEAKHFTLYPKDKRSITGHSGRVCSECVNKNNAQRNFKAIEVDKVCNSCMSLKPWTEFQCDKKSLDGLRGDCKLCRNAGKRSDWHENKEHNHKVRKEYRLSNIDKVLQWKKNWYYNDRENILIKQREYVEKNKEAKLEYGKKHYLENKHIYITNARKRENRLHEGINNDYMDRMKEIYYMCEAVSKESKIVHNVDHIIPLTHSNVCGLHVPWNVQVLTKNENQRKKNKFDGTHENESWRRSL